MTTKFNPVYSKFDRLIPFNEVFILPYLLWFLYIAATILYFLFTSKTDFYKVCAFLFSGMTICLIIYTVWPNGHYLRVNLDTLGRSNIFIDMLASIYSMDTATNVFPSIHTFNSIGAMFAINQSEKLRNIKWVQFSALILTILICLSTVFLKQHSVLDLFGGIVLSAILYAVVYAPNRLKNPSKSKQELFKFFN